jgi:hypothetical protein
VNWSTIGAATEANFTSASLDHILADTALHFSGGRFHKIIIEERGAYRGDRGDNIATRAAAELELEERIRRKKLQKAEKMQRKEDQGG